jgi:pSer/pThr/pTyr-binding forkhead associated (FHA) protein
MNQQISLVIGSGKLAGKIIPLSDPFFLIGRHPRCHLRAASRDVSKHHCALFVEEKRVVVRDLRSRTGTLVNDRPVSGEVELQAGDQLRVGPLAFVLWRGQVSADLPASDTYRTASAARTVIENDETVAEEVLLTEPSAPVQAGAPAPDNGADPMPVLQAAESTNGKGPPRKVDAGNSSADAAAILKRYRLWKAKRPTK